jgi:hypothetical protein
MKALIISLMAFNVIISNTYSQDITVFYKNMHKADSLFKIEQVDSAIYIYKKSFSTVDYVHTTFLKKLSNCLAVTGETEKVEYYEDLIDEQLKGTNSHLIEVVDSLFKEDQKVRRKMKYGRAFRCFRKRSEKCRNHKRHQKLISEFVSTDESTVNHLIYLISVHGFLGEEVLGEKSYKAKIILLHYDSDTLNKVLEPILDAALDRGKLLPMDYARIIDRHTNNFTSLQKYWTWPCTSESKFNFSELEVMKKRESIGIYGSRVSQEYKHGMWFLINSYE